MELTHFVLVTGPFVGRSSMLDTAQALRDGGAWVTEPDPHELHSDRLPTLEDWALSMLPAIPRTPAPIVVGYSAGTVLATWLAPRVGAAGLILVDGEIPPGHGPCPILPERVAALLAKRAGPEGLPRWSDWWPEDMSEPLGLGPLARLRPDLADVMRAEERAFPADWLSQTLDLEPWGAIPTGYLRLSHFFDAQAAEAAARGWPVEHIEGSHLHPAIMGTETAGALMAVAGAFG
ncbi:alpha/beta fold hydrolase [Pseudooceanicola sp.]|uniref:alpha/beta fold hydrolase n=1 Tax=Pseudooceanicola sp. TaxID=1914328 RepID=UPI0035C7279A